MPSLEERLQAVEDRAEIVELTARYCHAVAAGDGRGIADLFADDGSFQMGERTVQGREDLLKFYARVADNPPRPFIQNHVVELDGDRATGKCSVEIRVTQDGEAITAAGYYDDTYARVDGRWRFASRNFHQFHWVPLSKGWA